MLRLQRLLRYRHRQWLKHVKRPNIFLVAFAASLIPLIVVSNYCMSQWELRKRNYNNMPCCVTLWLQTLVLLVMSMLSKHNQKCQIKMLQNPVISLLTRKLLHHILLVLQVFQVQLTMLCRLAGLVHVVYFSQFESRSMVSGAWSMLRFFLIRGRIVPILQRIWCIRWVRNGLMHSPCLTLLLGLVSPVSVNYATFTMLYWKVHKVLAIPCIARRFLWYVRQFIVLRCLPTWCQHLVSCSLLTFMVQVRSSRLIFL